MIINRIYETQNLLSLWLVSFLVGLRTYQHPCTSVSSWLENWNTIRRIFRLMLVLLYTEFIIIIGGILVLYIYTRCPRRNVPDFGRVFLMLKYTDITRNTYVHSWTVTEIMAREVWNFDSCYTLIDYQIHIKTGRNMWFL